MNKTTTSYQSAIIIKSRQLSKRVKLLTLKPSAPFEWIPGQFIMTKTLIQGIDKIADYTIVSSNTKTGIFDIAVDCYPGSQVGYVLHNANKGDKITIKGPHGRFYYEKNDSSVVFIARDIGIAATMAILRYFFEQKFDRNIEIFNFLTPQFPEIFRDEIDKFSTVLDINYQIVDSNCIEENRLTNGNILKTDIQQMFGDFTENDYYLSGISQFNKNLRQKLINFGIDRNQIWREMFG